MVYLSQKGHISLISFLIIYYVILDKKILFHNLWYMIKHPWYHYDITYMYSLALLKKEILLGWS
jgi:hypothetical protein